MPWQGSEYISGSKYVIGYWIWQSSEYVSYNTLCEVTQQVNEYLLRDGRIQNLVKDPSKKLL